MRSRLAALTLAAVFALSASATLFSQAAPKPAASAPAPAKDLTGVWMMRNPPGKNGPWTNYTYTDPMKSPPSLTEWGQAQFKLAKDSNGGNYTLEQTSDQLKVTENFRRLDRDHLELDIRMEDPKALAQPWVTTFYYENRPNWELGEISCSGDYLDWSQVEKGGRDYKR